MSNRISSMPPLLNITLDEWLEIIQALPGGGFGNYRIKLRDLAEAAAAQGMSAYEVAVEDGFEGTEAEWLLTLVGPNGKSAYEIALDEGFIGTQGDWLDSIRGADGNDGKSAYEIAVEGGFAGTELQFNALLAGLGNDAGVAGAVFVKDIVAVDPSDNVGNKEYTSDGEVLVSCISTTTSVRVHLLAITGYSAYTPTVTVNGVQAVMTPRGDAPLFDGVADVEVSDGEIVVIHGDGASWTVAVGTDTPPVITSAVFSGSYPGSQTELKEGDEFDLDVTVDLPIIAYEVEDSGAVKGITNNSDGNRFVTPVTNFTVTTEIADRGDVVQALPARVRVMSETGSWSEWFATNEDAAVDGVNTLAVNNLYPTVSVTGIVYPPGQSAIKSGESATVTNSVADGDLVTYSSSTLDIPDTGIYETEKVVQYLSGNYVESNNFTVTAVRTANGAQATVSANVRIANIAPTVSIATPATRLRSGGNSGTVAQLHSIVLTSNQTLSEAPQVNLPEAAWYDVEWTPSNNGKTWTRRMQVHDNDVKGTYTFNSLVAANEAGMVQNTFGSGGSYILGGFVLRTIVVAAFPAREGAIGTTVSDTSKLRCSNLSKGDSGSLNFTYANALDNAVDTYAITGPAGVLNENGTLWYNADLANASSNSSGTMAIELEEVI